MAFPVEEKINDIRRALAANRDVVLTAPPGSGKTTCVPPALLDEPWLEGKKIVMLEPRRLAARNCATYIARKRGEAVGGTIGYQVRLERKISAATRLEVVTEGLLTQRLLSDPELSDVGLVIFDEFHERSLPCDTAFALALEVRRALRPDLRILVMSATLDADEVAAHLGDADIIRAEGRMFPVETYYLGDMSMTAAISKAIKETDGDILCFLPGEGEIRRVQDTVGTSFQDVRGRLGTGAPTNVDIDVLPLYGSLPKEEQDRVFERGGRRKVILATSIAETSVTIEGISTVIDSGLMRVPRFRPASGMSGLVTLPLTQDRAEQRRGRAGRVRAGVCYRLWSEGEQQSRPKKMMPEILDADLCSLVLTSAAWGALGREDLPWMTPPPASNWDQAVGLLKMLGALDGDGRLTKKGGAMAKLPMHPRLANMIIRGRNRPLRVGATHGEATEPSGASAEESGVRSQELGVRSQGEVSMASLLAAIVEEGSKSRETDIRKIAEEIKETPNRPLSKRVLQLARRFSFNAEPQSRRDTVGTGAPTNCVHTEGSLLALAYPDRVAKNRGNGTFRMVSGRGAFVDETDPLSKSPYLVCCELDDRAGDAKVFLGCPIDEDEIEDLFGDRVVEEPYCAWDRQNDRVKSVVRRKLGEMTLGEKPLSAADARLSVDVDTRVSEALLDGIRQKGVENLPCWTKESRQMRARMAFLSRIFAVSAGAAPEKAGDKVLGTDPTKANKNGGEWPNPTDGAILAALPGFISGMTKWKDLERLDLFSVFDFILAEAGHDRRELDRLAPTRMEVPSGSHMLIHYEGDEPTCEVRLQECFGLMETPKVAGGKVPVVMTLLSPAQRPIQITKDLAGFWREGYQLVRKDMRGRYPKHYWPEDPFTAVATRRTVKRAGQT